MEYLSLDEYNIKMNLKECGGEYSSNSGQEQSKLNTSINCGVEIFWLRMYGIKIMKIIFVTGSIYSSCVITLPFTCCSEVTAKY